MTDRLPRLHLVTHDVLLAHPAWLEQCVDLLAALPVSVHLRARTLEARTIFEIGTRILDRTPAGSPGVLAVNDRIDVARALGLQHVHLPESGVPVPAARKLMGKDALIGRSVHSPEQAVREALAGADYVFLGPVWTTPSHPRQAGIGTTALDEARPARVIAIGGIDPGRTATAIEHGAFGVAVISYVWNDPQPSAAAERILLSLRQSDG